ncbi:MAG: endonuclease Q family protein [Promethearchaeia archaeon]
MDTYNADLHIHSPHSIAVSQSLNLDTMLKTAKIKGLHLIGTGDILQPDWFQYMKKNLTKHDDGSFSYKEINFLLQTEIEDKESIHHVVFFPDFDTVKEIQTQLEPHSKNILNEWGGRPRVNLSPPELVDIVTDSNAIIGPAHAFTPYRAIFRQGKFNSLEDCYQDATSKVDFLELGLSANTELADRMECLKDVSFLSNSDAHSQKPTSLGREFNKFALETPSFEEIRLALRRKDDRKVTLNVGLHPKLGKYYNMFCGKCRRRVLFKKMKKKNKNPFTSYSITENFIIYQVDNPAERRKKYINKVSKKNVTCPACKQKTGKNYKMKLGVSERIDVISSYPEPKHPTHRPEYINAVPLYDILRAIKGIKSKNSKTVNRAYDKIIKHLGNEFDIVLDIPLAEVKEYNEKIGKIIEAIREDEIEYTPGGGGTYGDINLPQF